MKKLRIYPLLCLLFLGASVMPVMAQQGRVKKETGRPAVGSSRGAASLNELANTVLQAIQTNNFNALNAFLLGEEELVILKKRGSEDMKALLETQKAENLRRNLQTGYEAIIQQGISKTINWSDISVTEVRTGKGSAKNQELRPATILLMDKQNQPLQLQVGIVKLRNRFYLFRQMELKA
jgi:hypothetical protein